MSFWRCWALMNLALASGVMQITIRSTLFWSGISSRASSGSDSNRATGILSEHQIYRSSGGKIESWCLLRFCRPDDEARLDDCHDMWRRSTPLQPVPDRKQVRFIASMYTLRWLQFDNETCKSLSIGLRSRGNHVVRYDLTIGCRRNWWGVISAISVSSVLMRLLSLVLIDIGVFSGRGIGWRCTPLLIMRIYGHNEWNSSTGSYFRNMQEQPVASILGCFNNPSSWSLWLKAEIPIRAQLEEERARNSWTYDKLDAEMSSSWLYGK